MLDLLGLGGWDDPRRQGLLAAAAAMLQGGQGGFGGAVGRGLQSGLLGYNAAMGLRDRRQEEEQQRQMRQLQMDAMKQQVADRQGMRNAFQTAYGQPNVNLVANDDQGNPMPQVPGGGGLPEFLKLASPYMDPMQAIGMMQKQGPMKLGKDDRLVDPVTHKELLGAAPQGQWVDIGRDPKTGQTIQRHSITGQLKAVGSMPPQVNVNTKVDAFTPASEEAQKEFMKSTRTNYEALRAAPVALENIEKAKALIPTAKEFMGPGGNTTLNAAKFLNNRLGFNINTEGVKSAEELRTRVFQNVMDNLKKMDAQPSEMQQKLMMDALGSLETDPKALSSVLDAFGEIIKGKVAIHNREVTGAVQRGVKFPYDPLIDLRQPGGVAPTNDPLVLDVGGTPMRFKSAAHLNAYKKELERRRGR